MINTHGTVALEYPLVVDSVVDGFAHGTTDDGVVVFFGAFAPSTLLLREYAYA